MVMKKCSKCKLDKELSEFNKHRNLPGGLSWWCKLCNNAAKAQSRLRNRERYNTSASKRHHKSRQKKRAEGLCTECTAIHLERSVICLDHWVICQVRRLIHRFKPARPENYKLFCQQLIQLLDKTSHCPYTQEPLYPGDNVSLDHIQPVCKRPDLIYDISNLQWTSKVYNYAKHTMDREYFTQHYRITYIP